MDFFEVVKERHSIRAFASEPVEQDKLQKILETANAAPSAGNLQAYEIYLVRQSEHRAALAKASAQRFVADAPIVLVFCTHAARSARYYGQRGTHLYTVQDASVACTFSMLAVTALGLAAVWVGAFNDEAVRRAVGAPEGIVPVAILPIGYAAEAAEKTTRRRLDRLVHEV